MARTRNRHGALGRIFTQIGTLIHNLEDMHSFTSLSGKASDDLKTEIESAIGALKTLNVRIMDSGLAKIV